MSSTVWTRSEILELLTLITMIIISTIAAAWHIFMCHKVSFPVKLREEVTLTSHSPFRSSDITRTQEEETQSGRICEIGVHRESEQHMK